MANEIQRLTVTDTGNIALEEASLIIFEPIDEASVQTGMDSFFGAGETTVDDIGGNAFDITFDGPTFANVNVPEMVPVSANCTVTTIQNGGGGEYGDPPNAPSGFAASQVIGTDVYLAWTDNSSDESGFVIEKSLANAGSWSLAQICAVNAVSQVISFLQPNTLYDFRIKATGDSDSAWVTLEDVMTLGGGGPLGGSFGGPLSGPLG